MFSLGILDYTIQQSYMAPSTSNAYDFHLGGQLAGGDFDVLLYGGNGRQTDLKRSLAMAWICRAFRFTYANPRRAAFAIFYASSPGSMVRFSLSNAATGYKSSLPIILLVNIPSRIGLWSYI